MYPIFHCVKEYRFLSGTFFYRVGDEARLHFFPNGRKTWLPPGFELVAETIQRIVSIDLSSLAVQK